MELKKRWLRSIINIARLNLERQDLNYRIALRLRLPAGLLSNRPLGLLKRVPVNTTCIPLPLSSLFITTQRPSLPTFNLSNNVVVLSLVPQLFNLVNPLLSLVIPSLLLLEKLLP